MAKVRGHPDDSPEPWIAPVRSEHARHHSFGILFGSLVSFSSLNSHIHGTLTLTQPHVEVLWEQPMLDVEFKGISCHGFKDCIEWHTVINV